MSEEKPHACQSIFCGSPVAGPNDYCSVQCRRDAQCDDAGAANEQAYEFVNHPKHYNMHPAGIECIDVIEHMTHNIGAAMKYMWRTGLKPGEGFERDLDKAIWYINREKERLLKATPR